MAVVGRRVCLGALPSRLLETAGLSWLLRRKAGGAAYHEEPPPVPGESLGENVDSDKVCVWIGAVSIDCIAIQSIPLRGIYDGIGYVERVYYCMYCCHLQERLGA